MATTPKCELVAQLVSGRDDHITSMTTDAYSDGSVVTVLQTGAGTKLYYPATLGQAIQLRDFLNRHIDVLALKQTGSLAQRASDDPAQLAAIEEIVNQMPCDPDRGLRPSYLRQEVLDRVAAEGDQRLQDRLPRTIPVDAEAEAVLLGKISVLAVQASDVFDQVNGALQLAGHASDENVHASAHPQRWLQSARMDVQTGLMKLERAVKNPPCW